MSIQSIEDGKVMREYCKKLGREGVALRIKELAAEIMKGEGEYQSTLKYAGMIRALAMGCKWDTYWDEKQHIGFYNMIGEAKQNTK